MSIIIASGYHKSEVIQLITAFLERYMFIGLDHSEVMKINEHLDWMAKQRGAMTLQCCFETFPQTKTTTLAIKISWDV